MASAPRILIYGFEPFKRYRRNITSELIRTLPAQNGVQALILPVRFDRHVFLEPVQAFRPDWILGLGQCPRGQLLRLERRAFNQMRDRQQGLDQPIDPAGPDTLLLNGRLPANSLCRESYDAGRYVCNFSMYVLGRYALAHHKRYAFVHVPRHFPLQRAQNQLCNWLKQGLPEV